MSMQSFELDESTILELNSRPSSNNARNRRKEEKRTKGNSSPYAGGGGVNPRQAWLNSMHQGQGFNNVPSSGYGFKDTSPTPPKPKIKPTNPASHLDKEEMYDEIQDLKVLIASFKKEKALRQTHIAKLERELGKKDKLIEDTYSQTQSTYGPVSERSYASTTIETNSTITGLRQKCHKFECLLKEKETEIKTLKSDMRSTRLQELEIMCDTYYHEITRLTQVMDQKDYTTRTITPRTSSPIIGSEREKILESKIQRLEVDNSTLKKQITKTRTPSIGENTGLISEFATLSRGELEEQHQQKSKELADANLLIEELKNQDDSTGETIKLLTSKQNKQSENIEKMTEDRTKLEQKLAAVDGEHQAQKLVIRRLNKTVRQHEDEVEKLQKQMDKEQGMFRERMTEKTKIMTDLEYEIEDLKSVSIKKESVSQVNSAPIIKEESVNKVSSAPKSKEVPGPKRSQSPKRRSSNVRQKSDTKDQNIASEKLNEHDEITFKEKDADEKNKTDKSCPKKEVTDNKLAHRDSKRNNVKASEEQLKKEREEAAAKQIQKNYRNYSLIKSVSILQRVFKGHSLRSKVAKEEENESAEIIQSALKGLSVKTQHVKSLNEINKELTNKSKDQKTSLGKDGRRSPVLTSKDKDVSSKNQTTPVLNKYDEVSETTDEDDLVMM